MKADRSMTLAEIEAAIWRLKEKRLGLGGAQAPRELQDMVWAAEEMAEDSWSSYERRARRLLTRAAGKRRAQKVLRRLDLYVRSVHDMGIAVGDSRCALRAAQKAQQKRMNAGAQRIDRDIEKLREMARAMARAGE